MSALASLAALPGLSTSQRAAISGLETAISDVRIVSTPQPNGVINKMVSEERALGGIDIPLGFGSLATYLKFASNADSGFGIKFPGTQLFFRGSSVTNVGYKSGLPFDGDPDNPSDLDLAVSGDGIFQKVQDLGIGLRQGGIRTGPLNPEQEQALGLKGVMDELREETGRKVTIMVYKDEAAVATRGAYIEAPTGAQISELDPAVVEPSDSGVFDDLVLLESFFDEDENGD